MSAAWVAPPELSIYAAAESGAALAALFASCGSGDALTIDLGQVGEMDAAGLQLLLSVALKAARERRAVEFIAVPGHIRDRFEQFGVAGHLQGGGAPQAGEEET
jgi:ABC-type transporter Mla MlaB component